MRKAIIWLVVIMLIVSVVGTGIIVFVETTSAPTVETPSTPLTSGENAAK